MHRCPLVTRHNLTSKAVGKDIKCHASLLPNMYPLIHIAHAYSRLDVTWVDYVLCIGSCVRVVLLTVQSGLALGSHVIQWVSILLFHNMTKCWFQDLHIT